MFVNPPWPPEMDRDAVRFGEDLIAFYRDKKGRDVDVLGWMRWASEYRMHRANGLSHDSATARIKDDISRIWGIGGAAPVPAPSPVSGNGFERGDLIRVTHDGQYHPRFYSYWSNVFIDGRMAYVFAGHLDGEAHFFEVNLDTRQVAQVITPTFQYQGTTEGWSWGNGIINLLDGPQLLEVNPFSASRAEVIIDISRTHAGCRLWQSHSSFDGRTHCATVERITDSGPYQRIGTVVMRDGQQQFYEARGVLDESQISDNFLIIKESNERGGRLRLDNRLIDLRTWHERLLLDEDGAAGHSDCWQDFLIGEDDQAGACVRWNLNTMERTPLFSTWNMGHVSARAGRLLVSDARSIRVMDLNGDVQYVFDHGVTVTDYDSQVRANMDPAGRVACFMMRGDVYLLVL